MTQGWRRWLRFSIVNFLTLAVGFGLGLMFDDYVERYNNTRTRLPTGEVVVFGAVANPGKYQFSQPLLVMDALAMAGGVQPRVADMQRVSILRSNAGEQPSTIVVDVGYRSKQPRDFLRENFPLSPVYLHDGDVITVPTRSLTELDTD